MNKKFIKIVSILLMVMMLVSISVSSFAESGVQPKQLIGEKPTDGSIQTVGNKIIGVLQTVGVVISVIVLIVLGIKYMMGSAEEKAEYKKTMMPYVIGASLIFAASALAQVIYGFFSGITA